MTKGIFLGCVELYSCGGLMWVMVMGIRSGDAGGQPHVYVTTAISLAEFMFMKKGQWVAGVVGKGRFSLVDFLPKI